MRGAFVSLLIAATLCTAAQAFAGLTASEFKTQRHALRHRNTVIREAKCRRPVGYPFRVPSAHFRHPAGRWSNLHKWERKIRQSKRARSRCWNAVTANIAVAEYIARHSGGDPWPNCPDPYDAGGYSWQDTKNCESRGYSWSVDPPGYYCGPLQVDPRLWAWPLRHYGVRCS